MAKIYETKADVERERLNHQAAERKASQSQLVNTGLLAVGLSIISAKMHRLEIFEADTLNKPLSRLYRNAGKAVTWGFLAIGAVGLGTAAILQRKRRETDDALQKLGPEQIVYTPESAPDCGCNFNIQPRSLLEYAAQSHDATIGKS